MIRITKALFYRLWKLAISTALVKYSAIIIQWSNKIMVWRGIKLRYLIVKMHILYLIMDCVPTNNSFFIYFLLLISFCFTAQSLSFDKFVYLYSEWNFLVQRLCVKQLNVLCYAFEKLKRRTKASWCTLWEPLVYVDAWKPGNLSKPFSCGICLKLIGTYMSAMST